METVDWAALEHMYGSAADMPDTFRALGSADPADRAEAREHLANAVGHQGDFQSASPHVFRALLDLALTKGFPERLWVLDFIPRTIGFVHLYKEFGGDLSRGDMGDAHYDYGMASYRMGVESLDDFFTLARRPGAAIRAAAVRAISVFKNDADRVLPFLDSVDDSSEQVRASVVWSRNLLTRDRSALWRAHGDDPSLLVRATAVFLLAEEPDVEPDEELASTLRQAIGDPGMPARIFRVEVPEFFEFGLNIGYALSRVAPGDDLADTEFDSEEPPQDILALSVYEHPEVGAAWHQLSLVDRSVGNHAEALAAADRAVALSPDEAPYWANRAALRLNVEDARTAVDRDPAILDVLEGDPDLAPLRATAEWASVREIAG